MIQKHTGLIFYLSHIIAQWQPLKSLDGHRKQPIHTDFYFESADPEQLALFLCVTKML